METARFGSGVTVELLIKPMCLGCFLVAWLHSSVSQMDSEKLESLSLSFHFNLKFQYHLSFCETKLHFSFIYIDNFFFVTSCLL